jgi:outer membrane protein OmpU
MGGWAYFGVTSTEGTPAVAAVAGSWVAADYATGGAATKAATAATIYDGTATSFAAPTAAGASTQAQLTALATARAEIVRLQGIQAAGQLASVNAVNGASTPVTTARTAAQLASDLADIDAAIAAASGTAAVPAVADNTAVEHGLRLTFAAGTETDGGLSLSASTRITTTDNGDNGMLSHNRVNIGMSGVSVAIGATHGAMRNHARVADFHGYNNGGIFAVDNSTTGVQTDGGNNIYVSMKAGNLSFGVSSDVDGNSTEFGVSYAQDGFSFGVGANDADAWMARVGYTNGGLSVNIATNDLSDSIVQLGYEVSASTSISLAYEDNAAGSAFGAQLNQDLGAGATFMANIAQTADNRTLLGAGVMFNF